MKEKKNGRSKWRKSKKCYVLIRKKHIEGGHCSNGFCRISERTAKFMVDFYKMDFMKGIVLLVKLDEVCTVSWRPLATVYWSRDEIGMDDQSLFTGEMLIRLLCPSLSKGQTSSPKRYSCRERSGYCKIDDTEIR